MITFLICSALCFQIIQNVLKAHFIQFNRKYNFLRFMKINLELSIFLVLFGFILVGVFQLWNPTFASSSVLKGFGICLGITAIYLVIMLFYWILYDIYELITFNKRFKTKKKYDINNYNYFLERIFPNPERKDHLHLTSKKKINIVLIKNLIIIVLATTTCLIGFNIAYNFYNVSAGIGKLVLTNLLSLINIIFNSFGIIAAFYSVFIVIKKIKNEMITFEYILFILYDLSLVILFVGLMIVNINSIKVSGLIN